MGATNGPDRWSSKLPVSDLSPSGLADVAELPGERDKMQVQPASPGSPRGMSVIVGAAVEIRGMRDPRQGRSASKHPTTITRVLYNAKAVCRRCDCAQADKKRNFTR